MNVVESNGRRYEVRPTYRISSPSIWSSYIFVTKDKALAKLNELMSGDAEKEFRIEYDPNGQIIEGFDEDIQSVYIPNIPYHNEKVNG